jgi:hypothetical protein
MLNLSGKNIYYILLYFNFSFVDISLQTDSPSGIANEPHPESTRWHSVSVGMVARDSTAEHNSNSHFFV